MTDGTRADILDMSADALVAARRVASIVKDLRTFHKVDAVPSEHDLNEAVASVVRLARSKMQDQATIECNLGIFPSVG